MVNMENPSRKFDAARFDWGSFDKSSRLRCALVSQQPPKPRLLVARDSGLRMASSNGPHWQRSDRGACDVCRRGLCSCVGAVPHGHFKEPARAALTRCWIIYVSQVSVLREFTELRHFMNDPRGQQLVDLTGQGGQVQRLFPEKADIVVAIAPLTSSYEPPASARMTS